MATIARTIKMYRMQVNDASGQPHQDQHALWSYVQGLPYLSTGPHRAVDVNGDLLACAFSQFRRTRVHGDFGRTRLVDLPQRKNGLEERRDLTLDADEGLESIGHFLWRDMSHCPCRPGVAKVPFGVLLHETNMQAAGISAFEEYLNQLGSVAGLFTSILPIIPADPLDGLTNAGIKSIEVGVQRVADAGALTSFFRQATPETASIEIHLRPARGERLDPQHVRDRIMAWEEEGDAVKKLRVHLDDGGVIDILAPKLRYRREIPASPMSSRRVDPLGMRRALDDMFTDERVQLADILGRIWEDPET